MGNYVVEFTAWLSVKAKDYDDAIEICMQKIEKRYPDGEISIGDVEEKEN